jgi:hypothetical protein
LARRKSCLDWVVLDIVDSLKEMAFVSYETVEVIAVPERPGATKRAVRLLRREGLPCMDNGAEPAALDRLDYHVHVVGHDAPSEQAIADTVEVQKSLFDDLRDVQLLQPAGSQAFIEPAVGFCGSIGTAGKCFGDDTGQAVGQAERHKLGRFTGIEMRQVTA